jgi:type IV pilus assembly protein PilB
LPVKSKKPRSVKNQKKKLSTILVEAGVVTREQVETALTLQRTSNKRIGKILIELGHVTEEQIAHALSTQFSLPLVNWKSVKVEKELLLLVPRAVAEKKQVFPLELKENELLVAMSDPLDLGAIDYISFRNGLRTRVSVSTESGILDAIEKHYGSSGLLDNILQDIPDYENVEFVKERTIEDLEEASAESLIKLSEAAPVVKLVTTILVDAVKSRASDVHIEPREKYVQVRYRIDGELRDIYKYPGHLHAPVTSRVKIISHMDITIRMRPQDGRSTLRVEGKDIDLRVSTLPAVTGETIVIRLLDRSNRLLNINSLGIPDAQFKQLTKLIANPQGMILITGPTGSGKTTSLYAILQQLRSETDNIISIENPVEYKIPGITQVQVNETTGLTFPVALRSILRQDPDIIMVGEIRDLETAEIALRASITGHLVFSTVHTNDTVSSIPRLLDIGIPHYLINAGVTGILAQRLVRRICQNCKTEVAPPEIALVNDYPPLESCFEGVGCRECQYTGYHGQIGAFEFLELTSKFREAVTDFAREDTLWEVARANGTSTLFEDAWEKVKNGITTVDEVIGKIHYKSFEAPAKKRKTKTLLFNISGKDSALIKRILQAQGYPVLSASGDDVSGAAIRYNPDLIIVDGAQDGFGFLKQLRSDVRGALTPVFALLDSSDKKKEALGSQMGVKGFLHRPITSEKLMKTLRYNLRALKMVDA